MLCTMNLFFLCLLEYHRNLSVSTVFGARGSPCNGTRTRNEIQMCTLNGAVNFPFGLARHSGYILVSSILVLMPSNLRDLPPDKAIKLI